MSEEEKDLINLKISISPEKYMKELIKENQKLKEWKKLHSASILAKENIRVNEENQKYKEVIDKANKFIQENCYEHYDSYNDQQYYILESKKELLDILKEVE